MKTQEIVDHLIRLHNGWSRTGDNGVLRYLNMANSLLVSVDAEQNVVFDSSTDELPTIDTVSGTLLYTMPGTVRRVAAVLIKQEEYSSGIGFSRDYDRKIRTSYPNSYVFGGVEYIKVPYIKTRDRTNSTTLSRIRFTANPGTTTGYYYYQAYKVPTDVLSESIQHDVPEPYDIQFLLPAATALIAGVQNYTLHEAIEYVTKVISAGYAQVASSGDQGYLDCEPVSRDF